MVHVFSCCFDWCCDEFSLTAAPTCFQMLHVTERNRIACLHNVKFAYLYQIQFRGRFSVLSNWNSFSGTVTSHIRVQFVSVYDQFSVCKPSTCRYVCCYQYTHWTTALSSPTCLGLELMAGSEIGTDHIHHMTAQCFSPTATDSSQVLLCCAFQFAATHVIFA